MPSKLRSRVRPAAAAGVKAASMYSPSRERLLCSWVTLTCASIPGTTLHTMPARNEKVRIEDFIYTQSISPALPFYHNAPPVCQGLSRSSSESAANIVSAQRDVATALCRRVGQARSTPRRCEAATVINRDRFGPGLGSAPFSIFNFAAMSLKSARSLEMGIMNARRQSSRQ